MKKTLIPLFFAAVSMAATMQAKDNDPVVITVNGQKVLRSEFEYFYNKNNDQDVAEEKTNGKTSEAVAPVMDVPSESDHPDLPLDAVQVQILRRLLRGEPVRDIIKENRLMPSMVADTINEAMFDEIGDTVLSCEDDVLSLVDDYRDDIAQLLGENRS